METLQIRNPADLGKFIQQRQDQTLELAQKESQRIAREVVEIENALMDFEILLGMNMDEKERERLTKECRKLREESWAELKKEANGDYSKMMQILDEL
ncbi:hypothetical protein J4447_04530 [Candidatus Pacearchaeota archaeon]|nr:hypothetical protein [Candidatus Pacearchaeota archaeon]